MKNTFCQVSLQQIRKGQLKTSAYQKIIFIQQLDTTSRFHFCRLFLL